MATLQEELKPSVANSVLKTKNVAKKSTTRLSQSCGSSRSASPCSVTSSVAQSREASPDVRHSSLNGQLKQYSNSQGAAVTSDQKSLSNGPSVKHEQDEDRDGRNPAKQARLQIEQQHDGMWQDAAGTRSPVSSEEQVTPGALRKRMNRSSKEAGAESDVQDGSNKREVITGNSVGNSDTYATSSAVNSTTDGATSVKNEQDATSCGGMSKSSFIQAKDALKERLKAAVLKFSERSLGISERCSDGERSPTPANTPSQASTPSQCNSPLMPRPGMVDKGNLFEIMTLDLGKSSQDSASSVPVSEEPRSQYDSADKPSKDLSDNMVSSEVADSSTDGGDKCRDHGHSQGEAKNTANDDVGSSADSIQIVTAQGNSDDIEKETSEVSGKSVSCTKTGMDKDDDILLLGASVTNENFDAVDDSLLDEEPKKERNTQPLMQDQEHSKEASCEMKSLANGHPEEGQSMADSGSAEEQPVLENGKTSELKAEGGVPCEAEAVADLDIVNKPVQPKAAEHDEGAANMECSPSESMASDGADLTTDDQVESCTNVSNKRKLSASTTPDDNQVKKGRTDEDMNGLNDESNSDVDKSTVTECSMKDEGDATFNNDNEESKPDVKHLGTEMEKKKFRRTQDGDIKTEGVLRISRQALENLINKRLKEKLTASDTVKLITDLRGRIDKLTEQLNKCKATAKSYQLKLADITKPGRYERRRVAKGLTRHVGVQVDVPRHQASQLPSVQTSHHSQVVAATQPSATQPVVTQTAVSQGATLPQAATFVTSPPPIAPKGGPVSTSAVGGTGQAILVPVASASANGTMTLIAQSAGANIPTSGYRFTAVQPAKATGVTVKEILDHSRLPLGGTAVVTQASAMKSSVPLEAGGQEKVIDLTEDDENSASKAPLTSITLAPSSGNIPAGTYLVPVTSGPIILQSVVRQQLHPPLLLPSARPPTPQQQQQITSAGQQLVNLAPAQSGSVRSLFVQAPAVQQPAMQPIAISKAAVTTQTVTKPAVAGSVAAAKAAIAKVMKHPAPLPPQPATSKIAPEFKNPPPKPRLTISRVPQGIVLSWNLSLTEGHATIANYQLYAYQEGSSIPVSSLWKRVGDVKALPLPMACTLTQFHEGNKYHFAVRGVDEHGRIGPFSDPNSIHLETTAKT